MNAPKPYELADRAIEQLNKQAVELAAKTKRRLLIDGFDELNVMRQIDKLYENLDRNNRKRFKELFVLSYTEMYLFAVGRKTLTDKEEDEIDELVEMYLAGLLDEPNEVTKYTYSSEVIRKRDRAKESINAVIGRAAKQVQLDKALRFWSQMTGWYADFVWEDAVVSAMKAAGIKKVVRHERNDDKVCKVCKDADGEVYDIDKIPPKSHLHCRRWFTPYRG